MRHHHIDNRRVAKIFLLVTAVIFVFMAVISKGNPALFARHSAMTEKDISDVKTAFAGGAILSLLLITLGVLLGFYLFYWRNRLVRAVEACDLKETKRLLDKGVRPDMRGSLAFGSPLAYAVYKQDAEIVELLMQHGASIKTKGYLCDELLLATACDSYYFGTGSFKIIRLLLMNGIADFDDHRWDGKNVMQHAQEWKDQNLITLLEDAHKKANPEK
jgi:hypothetical protein